jgi:hypothetical protein
MRWRLPRFRFGLRTLLFVVTACAIALGFLFWTPYNRRIRLNVAARSRIDRYELSLAGGGDPAKAPPELVAILGDSRLKHWNRVGPLEFVSPTQLLSYGQDHLLRVWDADSGRQTSQEECRGVALCGPGGCGYFLDQDGKSTAGTLPRECLRPWISTSPAGCSGSRPTARGRILSPSISPSVADRRFRFGALPIGRRFEE